MTSKFASPAKTMCLHHCVEANLGYYDGVKYMQKEGVLPHTQNGMPIHEATYYRWKLTAKRDATNRRRELMASGLEDMYFTLLSSMELRRKIAIDVAMNGSSDSARLQALEQWRTEDKELAHLKDEYVAVQLQQIDAKQALLKEDAMLKQNKIQSMAQ